MTNSELQYCQEAIQVISELKEDWNLYGAKPFKKKFLKQFNLMFPKLNHRPDKILPTGRESVQFEYYTYSEDTKEREVYLEFEIFENKVGILKVIGNSYAKAIEFERDIKIYKYTYICWLCDIINMLVEITFGKDKIPENIKE